TDGIRLVGPWDGDEHGTEDLLARKAPVVRHVRENGGDRVVAFAQQPFLRRKAANHNAPPASLEPFRDVAAHPLKPLLVYDGADVTRLVQWIAELKRLDLLPESIEELVEDIAVEEKARARRAGLALTREAHCCNDTIDDPVFVRVGENDRGAL